MTTTEKIQALNSAVSALQLQVGSISYELASETNRISLHIVDCEQDISTVNARYNLLAADDADMQQEINVIAGRVDNHEGRIRTLELDMAEADSSISALQDADTAFQGQITLLSNSLHEDIHDVAIEVDDHEGRISALELGITTSGNSISALQASDTALQGQITLLGNTLHNEIHTVAVEVDDHEGRITTLEVGMTNTGDSITLLEGKDEDLQNQITEMDEEHHQELHDLALALDNYSTRILDLEIFKAETPNQVVMSESQYHELGTPDYDTFYYTYEEDY